MKRFTYLLLTLTATFLLVSPALAVEYGGVGGQPANPVASNPRTKSIFIYSLTPGTAKSDAVKIYNQTDSQRTIAVGAVDSALSSDGAFTCKQAADPKTGVGSWVQLSTDQVTIPAGGSQVVPFTVTVPAKAGVGEHDGCITIQDVSANQTVAKSGVTLSFRSAIRMVVTVPGTIVKKLTLASITVGNLKSDTYAVVPTAKNEGNVSLDTNVTASIRNLFGGTLASVSGTYPVLPDSSASWNLRVKRPFWGGWYKGYATVSYNANPTAELGVSSGASKTEQLSSGIFFAPPAPVAMIIELVILAALVILGVWYWRRLQDIRRIKSHWELYVVKEGETIVALARDRHSSWKKIARVNRLKPPYLLRKGQRLRVPPKHEG